MNKAVNFLEIPMPELLKLMGAIGREVRQLAERGDKLAAQVYHRYCEAAHHRAPDGSQMNRALRQALQDYMYRDLTVSDRAELGAKFGHLVEGEQGDGKLKIFVPGAPTTKQ